MKLFCITVLFSPYVYSAQGCEWKIISKMSLLKKKSWSHSSEEIFRPADSQSLRLNSAVFEIRLLRENM